MDIQYDFSVYLKKPNKTLMFIIWTYNAIPRLYSLNDKIYNLKMSYLLL